MTAYLSLGSNVGKREDYLRRACQALQESGVRLRRLSSLYETEPVEFRDQGWFLNCVAEVETTLPPLLLLRRLQIIEEQLGRQREIPKGPRTIDLDLLLYGDLILQTAELEVPHPAMLRRRFVLEPLREIAPALRVPGNGRTVEELLGELQDSSLVRCVGPLTASGKAVPVRRDD